VADGHEIGAEHDARPLEEFVPRRPRRVLQRSTRTLRAGGHVLAIRDAAEAQRGGRRHHEPLVGARRSTELMVEMGHADELQFVRATQIVQDLQEGNGVGTA